MVKPFILFLILSTSLWSPHPCYGFGLGDFIDKAEDAVEDVGNTAKDVVEDAQDTAEDVIENALPTNIIKDINKLKHQLSPEHLIQSVHTHFKNTEQQILSQVNDPYLKSKADLILHDFKFLYQKSKELVEGPCGAQVFTKEIPAWFKNQIINAKDLVTVGAHGGKIVVDFAKNAPTFIKFAQTLSDIAGKAAIHGLDPQNAEVMSQIAEHISEIVGKLQDIPEIIESSIVVGKDVGLILGEGATCAATTVTEIEEFVEAIVEALAGVASCVESEGVGCLTEVAAAKSVIVSALDGLGEVASCLATVATTAAEGSEDVVELVKLLYAFTDLIDGIAGLKDDIFQIIDLTSSLSDDIKKDIPDLENELQEISQILGNTTNEVRQFIPEVREFFFSLLAQFKGNINQLLTCSANVGYIGLLVGYVGKDGVESIMDAIPHLLKADQATASLKKFLGELQQKAVHRAQSLGQEVGDEIENIKDNPAKAVTTIPELLKSVTSLPIHAVTDTVTSAEDTISQLTDEIITNQNQAKQSLEGVDLSGIENIQKPAPPLLEGADINRHLSQAQDRMDNLRDLSSDDSSSSQITPSDANQDEQPSDSQNSEEAIQDNPSQDADTNSSVQDQDQDESE